MKKQWTTPEIKKLDVKFTEKKRRITPDLFGWCRPKS